MRSFSPVVAERIGWYVYALVDPRDQSVFYVGKGTGNRVFAHAAAAADVAAEATAKLERIRAIQEAGLEVEAFIIRHGIDSERQAYEIEAAVIDTFRLLAPDLHTDRFELTNAVLGHRHTLKGLAHASQVASLYDAPQAPPFDEPVLLLKIPGLWTPRMSATDLYEATRGWWRIGQDRRTAARYACAVNKGVIRAVYRIGSWRERREGDRDWQDDAGKPVRWGFDGEPAPEMDRYVDTSVAHLFKRGEADPVKLIGPTATGATSDTPPGEEQQHLALIGRAESPTRATPDSAGEADAGTGPTVADGTDLLVATVAGALVRMTEWFRIEAHTSRYPEGAYVQVRLDGPELGPDSPLLLEATGPVYLNLSAEQQARMLELGWVGPTDPRFMPSVNYERFVEADEVSPGPLAEFVMATLREVYGATDDDEYTFSPADLGADVAPDPDALESFEVVGLEDNHEPAQLPVHDSADLESSTGHALPDVGEAPELTGPPADAAVFHDDEPWIHYLETAWATATRARPLTPWSPGLVPFPLGLHHQPSTMTPSVVRTGRAQWGAVLHLLVFGCGWWRPGTDFDQSRREDDWLGQGRQWVAWKVLPGCVGQDELADFLGWATAGGDDLVEAAMPIPDEIREAYGVPGKEPAIRAADGSNGQQEYRELWHDQSSPDPLQLASHCSAPWGRPRDPLWLDYPPDHPTPTSYDGFVEQPRPQLLFTVDTYAGWYLELCRRGLVEADPVLVSVRIRALGTLGTFRIGGGHRPHLLVNA